MVINKLQSVNLLPYNKSKNISILSIHELKIRYVTMHYTKEGYLLGAVIFKIFIELHITINKR